MNKQACTMKKTFLDYALVGIQFCLFALFLLDFLPPFSLPLWIQWISLVLAVIGCSIVVLAILQLRNSLTAFPTPKDGSVLITNGLYKWVRHPIYTGILLSVYGYALYSTSSSRLIISLVLTALFFIKTEYEERQLKKKYPLYTEYAERTGRFFP